MYIERGSDKKKKDSLSKKPNESDLVAGTGLEPMTFGL